jgi:hypothetical protein
VYILHLETERQVLDIDVNANEAFAKEIIYLIEGYKRVALQCSFPIRLPKHKALRCNCLNWITLRRIRKVL